MESGELEKKSVLTRAHALIRLNGVKEETAPKNAWYQGFEVDGKRFSSGEEYFDYMNVHRLWGKHPHHPTRGEWEEMKAHKR